MNCLDLIQKPNEPFDVWVRRLQQSKAGRKKLAAMFGGYKGPLGGKFKKRF